MKLILLTILSISAVGAWADDRSSDVGLADETSAIPDYSKWERIKMDMTKAEVKDVLGNPLEILGEDKPGYALIYGYGTLIKQCPQIPCDYKFVVNFLDGKVFNIEDPFNHRLSHDGRPLKPETYLPADGAEFSHYPRIFDVRWFPVSGAYPMSYEVCVSTRLGTPKDPETWEDETIKTQLPYLNYCFAGANPGRVRIRGINALGPGPWSEYINFTFKR